MPSPPIPSRCAPLLHTGLLALSVTTVVYSALFFPTVLNFPTVLRFGPVHDFWRSFALVTLTNTAAGWSALLTAMNVRAHVPDRCNVMTWWLSVSLLFIGCHLLKTQLIPPTASVPADLTPADLIPQQAYELAATAAAVVSYYLAAAMALLASLYWARAYVMDTRRKAHACNR